MKNLLKNLLISFAIFYAPILFAAPSFPDAVTMLENFAKSIPDLMMFVTALAYVMGMWFIVKGLLSLKQYGESRTQGSSQHELKGPMIYLFVGAALLYLPTTVMYSTNTFWITTTPYAYQDALDQTDPWQDLIYTVFQVVELIGVIAFIRGLIILTHLGQGSAQPGSFGRAMAHIIGGIFCINIYFFIQTILNTLSLAKV